MPPDSSLTVAVAERPGGDKPSEDRIFLTPNAVILLDGATQPVALDRDGGWIADQFGRRIAAALDTDPHQPLRPMVEREIVDMVNEFDLQPGQAPSTTLSIVCRSADVIDVYVLCDSPVIVLDTAGEIHEVRDDRLADVERQLDRPPGRRNMNDPRWRAHFEQFEAHRNKPGGFWCVSASPEAAGHAREEQFSVDDWSVALAITDGVSNGIDKYGIPPSWHHAIKIAADDPHQLIEQIHNAEATDSQCVRWPRTKVHDDKTAAVIEIATSSTRS